MFSTHCLTLALLTFGFGVGSQGLTWVLCSWAVEWHPGLSPLDGSSSPPTHTLGQPKTIPGLYYIFHLGAKSLHIENHLSNMTKQLTHFLAVCF